MESPKPRGRPFAKGVSGNPKGRPFGARNRTTVAAERLLADDAADVVRVMLTAAKAGDLVACRALLSFILPPRREAFLPRLDLPECKSADDVARCQEAILHAAADGVLTSTEATALGGLVELRRRSLETLELERRLQALEGPP